MDICILGPKTRKEQELWLIDEAKKQFEKVTYAEIPMTRIENGIVYFKNTKLFDYDCILPRIPRSYRNYGYSICKLLENKVTLPIKPESILIAHNKFLTLLALHNAGIPIPASFLAYTRNAFEDVINKIEYPVVVKLPYGSLGKGVMFAESKESIAPLLDTIESMNKGILVEEFIGKPGEDIRAFVIGNEVIAAMRRKARKGERRANIGAGGKGRAISISKKLEDIAVSAAKVLGLGIAGVDIIESKEGPVVIEANVNVNFEEITRVTKHNIAKEMIEYLRQQSETAKKGLFISHFFKVLDELRWGHKVL